MMRATIGSVDRDIWVIDWSDWLLQKSDEEGTTVTITGASWTATGGLVVLSDPPPSVFDGGRQCRVWWDSSGCAVGAGGVTLSCAITTSAGHERAETVTLSVVSR